MRRRRRKKHVFLNEKNLVPLIMECLNRDGKIDVVQYVNVGNSFRFPVDCVAYVPPLQKNAGFQCRLLNVGEDILTGQGMMMMKRTEDSEELVLSDTNDENYESLHQSEEEAAVEKDDEEGEKVLSTEDSEIDMILNNSTTSTLKAQSVSTQQHQPLAQRMVEK